MFFPCCHLTPFFSGDSLQEAAAGAQSSAGQHLIFMSVLPSLVLMMIFDEVSDGW